ncbi:MAG: ATP-binding protein [Bacteroidota bacterium]|nr:ATP-binding protein [Bacteroidota bacterium]
MPAIKRANIEIEKLKNALAYAENIIDAIHEPLVVLHPDLTIRTANHAFYKTFHCTPKQTEEKLIYEVGNGEWNIPKLKVFFEKILVSKSTYRNFELHHHFKNIGERFMILNARKLVMEDEKEPMVLLVIDDVTVKKNYEQQIAKEKSILAENQRLQDIARQKDDFISMASHELKTPVTSIKAFAQLLEKDFAHDGNPEAASMLSRMNSQIVKLTSLIEDLLDVRKMEGGKLQYHLAYFDLNELICDVVREMQLTTKIHFIYVNLAKTIPIYGDRDRIGQVLTNLLSNAIKYSPQSKKIEVTSANGKLHIKVCIRDYGIGIDKDKQGKVFERFYRVTGSKENTYPGLGLGLYISSEIIKRHKGLMSIQSARGKGATFCFRLPFKNIEVAYPE